MKELGEVVGSRLTIREAADTLQVEKDVLIQYLASARWIFKYSRRAPWGARQEVVDAGLLEHTGINTTSMYDYEVVMVGVTAKGLEKLSHKFKKFKK